MTIRKVLLTGIVWLASASTVYAQDGDQVWTPALSMQYDAIQGVAMSPDGQFIAYVVRTPIMEGSKSE